MSAAIIKNSKPSGKVVRIAIDAMGGDKAPRSVVKGCAKSIKKNPNVKFILYGDASEVGRLAQKYNIFDHCKIVHCEDVIEAEEKPSNALRRGKNSSMFKAIDAVKNGEADAVVSSGNTGAIMAIGKVRLRTLTGIDRPAIGGILPNDDGYSVMLDIGANVHASPENLFEFAIMGESFYRALYDVEYPSIGLLNVGSEKNKGNETVKTALSLIQESDLDLNLHGYVEGDDISKGTTNVVVTDGFSGNIALKSIEGLAKLYTATIRKEFKRSPIGWLAVIITAPIFRKIKKKMDPRKYNGAMLLGLNGIVIKSHGGTDHIGFANAIKVAYKLVENKINDHITAEMISAGNIIDTGDTTLEE